MRCAITAALIATFATVPQRATSLATELRGSGPASTSAAAASGGGGSCRCHCGVSCCPCPPTAVSLPAPAGNVGNHELETVVTTDMELGQEQNLLAGLGTARQDGMDHEIVAETDMLAGGDQSGGDRVAEAESNYADIAVDLKINNDDSRKEDAELDTERLLVDLDDEGAGVPAPPPFAGANSEGFGGAPSVDTALNEASTVEREVKLHDNFQPSALEDQNSEQNNESGGTTTETSKTEIECHEAGQEAAELDKEAEQLEADLPSGGADEAPGLVEEAQALREDLEAEQSSESSDDV